jgi:hypothetical protein
MNQGRNSKTQTNVKIILKQEIISKFSYLKDIHKIQLK